MMADYKFSKKGPKDAPTYTVIHYSKTPTDDEKQEILEAWWAKYGKFAGSHDIEDLEVIVSECNHGEPLSIVRFKGDFFFGAESFEAEDRCDKCGGETTMGRHHKHCRACINCKECGWSNTHNMMLKDWRTPSGASMGYGAESFEANDGPNLSQHIKKWLNEGHSCIGFGEKWTCDYEDEKTGKIRQYERKEPCDVKILNESNLYLPSEWGGILHHGPYCKECASWNWCFSKELPIHIRTQQAQFHTSKMAEGDFRNAESFEAEECPHCSYDLTDGSVELHESFVCPACDKEIMNIHINSVPAYEMGAESFEAEECPHCSYDLTGGSVELHESFVCPACDKEIMNIHINSVPAYEMGAESFESDTLSAKEYVKLAKNIDTHYEKDDWNDLYVEGYIDCLVDNDLTDDFIFYGIEENLSAKEYVKLAKNIETPYERDDWNDLYVEGYIDCLVDNELTDDFDAETFESSDVPWAIDPQDYPRLHTPLDYTPPSTGGESGNGNGESAPEPVPEPQSEEGNGDESDESQQEQTQEDEQPPLPEEGQGGGSVSTAAESFGVEEVMCNECLWGGSHNELISSEDEFGNYSGCPKCQSDNLIDFTGQNKYAEEFGADMTVADGFKLGVGAVLGFTAIGAAFGLLGNVIGNLIGTKEE